MNGTQDILRQELIQLDAAGSSGKGWQEDVQAIRIAARLLEHAAYERGGGTEPMERARLIVMASELERLVQSKSAVLN